MKVSDRQPLEATFSTLSISIFSSAMMAMGEIAHPQSGDKNQDLPMAQFNIDLLVLLRDKTKNNLSAEESQLLGQLINELQMKYLLHSKPNT